MEENKNEVFDFTNDVFDREKFLEMNRKQRKKYYVDKVTDGKIRVTFKNIDDEQYECIYKYKHKKEIYQLIKKSSNLVQLKGVYVKDFNITEIEGYEMYILKKFHADYSFWDGCTNFMGADFGDEYVIFDRSNFGDGDLSFKEVNFGDGNVSFKEVNFGDGNVSFESTISNGVIFDRSSFGKGDISFSMTYFGNNNASFYGTNFGEGDIDFSDTDFGGDVNFNHANFDGNVSFSGACFGDGYISFEYVNFGEGDVSFDCAEFSNGVIFDRSSFGKGDVSFFMTNFGCDSVSFYKTNFGKGDIDFSDTDFGVGDVNFNNANFDGNVLFSETNFNEGDITFCNISAENIMFSDIKFQSHVDLRFEKISNLIIQDCVIEKTLKCNCTGCRHLSFHDTLNLGQIYMNWEKDNILNAITDGYAQYWVEEERKERKFIAGELSSQFRMLKENFHNIGYYEDEDAAYRAYMKYRVKDMKGIKKIFYKIFGWVGGYGTKPLTILGTALGVIAGYGLLNWWQQWIAFTNGNSFSSKFWESMYFSGITFFTIGFGDITPLNQTAGMFSVFEGFLGVTLMSYFTVALVRKLLR